VKNYTTDPRAKGRFVRSLRDLADYLDQNIAIPVPETGACLTLHASSAENGGRAQVDYLARLMNAEVTDDTADGGHYWAVRNFGPIGYEIVAIPDLVMAAHDALMSYRDCITPGPQPDTWT
jgi:hypothetical protein